MKTRDEIYGREAAPLLRDISMYKVLTEEQALRLYPGKEDIKGTSVKPLTDVRSI